MYSDAKTIMPCIISVDSIITLFENDLRGRSPKGDVHNFWEFVYVKDGEYRVFVDGEQFCVKEGELITFMPNAFHIWPTQMDAIVEIISFRSSSVKLKRLANRVVSLSAEQKEALSSLAELGHTLLCFLPPEEDVVGMMPRPGVKASELQKLKNHLELFLLDICEAQEDEDLIKNTLYSDDFDAACEFMKANISKSLSLSEIAQACSMSVSKLKSLFEKTCGCGVINYFISLKITAAKKMITDSNKSFTEISDILGFSSVHYFSKLFKQKTGITPSQYAKEMNK